MSEYSWIALREEAIAAFGDTPGAAMEQAIVDAFEQRPRLVAEAIASVGKQVKDGKARSGWAVLRSRVQGAVRQGEDVVASGKDERGLHIRQAEAWIKNAGLHLDRESELIDSLFGDFGILRAHAGDDVLRRQMLTRWRERRPVGDVEQATERQWA